MVSIVRKNTMKKTKSVNLTEMCVSVCERDRGRKIILELKEAISYILHTFVREQITTRVCIESSHFS